MAEYTDTYKKYFMDKLGLPVEQFDDVITPAKRASAEHISKMNRMAKIAMEGGSMKIKLPPSIPPEQRLGAFKNELQNKIEYVTKNQTYRDLAKGGVGQLGDLSVDVDSIASKYGVKSDEAEKMYRQLKQKQIRSKASEIFTRSTAEKYKAVLTEAEKRTAKNLLSGLSGNIGQAAPMETPYGKSQTMSEILDAMTPKERIAAINKPYVVGNIEKAAPMETPFGKSFLSYTPEGKIAGKTGAALRGLGKLASRVASPIGAALTAVDLGQALSEIQDKGAAKIAEDYKNSQSADASPTIQEYKKNPRMADAAPKNMELRGEEESPKAGVIMTPEVVKALEEKRQKLIETRRDLEKQRRMDEYDQRARARQMRVRDTLAETGLDGQ